MNYNTCLSVINSSQRDINLSDPYNLLRLTISTMNKANIYPQSSSVMNQINSNNNNNIDLMNTFLMKYKNNNNSNSSNHNRSIITHLNCHKNFIYNDEMNLRNNRCEETSDNSSLINNNDHNRSNNKIQLNFSVDRLLSNNNTNDDDNSEKNNQNELKFLNGQNMQLCNEFRKNTSNSNRCCISLNNSNSDNNICNNNRSTECECYQLSSSSFDTKKIIRPTPVRIGAAIVGATSTGNGHVIAQLPSISSFSELPSRIIKYHLPLQAVNNFKTLPCGIRQTTTSIRSSNLTGTERNHTSSSSTNQIVQNNSSVPSSSKRKRSWSRAVFSNLQRKGLEIQFQQQKYITKPDRRKLAARLNLTDAQVKVWFQNRRMKWRHTRENLKSGHEKPIEDNLNRSNSGTSSEDEIDVVTE